jgi:hypothetical protein
VYFSVREQEKIKKTILFAWEKVTRDGGKVSIITVLADGECTEKKKKIKCSSYIRKFKMEQLQSHI